MSALTRAAAQIVHTGQFRDCLASQSMIDRGMRFLKAVVLLIFPRNAETATSIIREVLFWLGIAAAFVLAVWMYASMFLGREDEPGVGMYDKPPVVTVDNGSVRVA